MTSQLWGYPGVIMMGRLAIPPFFKQPEKFIFHEEDMKQLHHMPPRRIMAVYDQLNGPDYYLGL